MTVLTATDFSEPSKRALRVAGREARLRGESLTIVHSVELEQEKSMWWNVFEPDRISPERLHENARRRLETFVREQLPPDRRPDSTTYKTAIDAPAESIRNLADEIGPSLITIGATGRGSLESVVLGSTAEELIRTASSPVLTVPDGRDPEPFEKILVPVDFSRCASDGLQMAIDLVRRDGSELLVMHETENTSLGVGRPSFGPNNGVEHAQRHDFEAKLSQYLSQFDLTDIDYDMHVSIQNYDTHTPAEGIVAEARRRAADLIVMGTHGRRGFQRFLMGSTTLKVLHEMPCCLMTVSPHCR